MSKYNVYKSIIDKNIKKEFKDSDWCSSLMYYGTWGCKIDGLIAAAYLFCPEIIEIEGHIFIKEFCNFEEGEEMEFLNDLKQYYSNKKDIEMSVNTWSIGSFFLGDIELMDNENVLIEFGKALVYFWKKRVDELFPNRNIVVEMGMELFGEFGISITLYEEEK
ncbi:hypothetical protein [Fusobacterium polymorphum]|uniref:hypothetical protein n=1 Tax=Fusobacterium nucleatum subsp. polymorphum TaxID=76857 RepID=UPI003009DEE1